MVRPDATNASQINVLLVEDDAADTRLIQTALKRNADVGEVVARNLPGRALLELAAGRLNPNLILLDIVMPRLDGFQFLEVLRRLPAMSDIPVAFLTTSSSTRDMKRAGETSAFDYIVKPESFEELETRIDAVIKKTANGGKGR
jgi:DNA-binding response OmpR family regulator